MGERKVRALMYEGCMVRDEVSKKRERGGGWVNKRAGRVDG